MQFPLMQWMLHAQSLPESLCDAQEKAAFFLPGADALNDFSDLLGGGDDRLQIAQDTGAAYALDGLFEADLAGEVSLKKEIDFGALEGDWALLTFEHIAGSGEILLGGQVIARFPGNFEENLKKAYDSTGMPCGLAVDVTDALMDGKSETLEIRFADARPAGVMGAVFLSVTRRAHLSRVSIHPDKGRRTMTVRARVTAHRAGRYVLRVQPIPGENNSKLPPARETDIFLDAGEEKGVQLSLEMDAAAFVPGQAYDAPALKIQLFAREENKKTGGLLCDDALLLCGYGAPAPRVYLPLDMESCMGDASRLCSQIREMGIWSVSLPAPAPDALYRAFSRAGISVVQHVSEEIRPMFTRYPCVALSDFPLSEDAVSPEAAAWQMAGPVAFPRAIDETMSPREMLMEVSGLQIDAGAQPVADVLAWLRAVQIRLRAEAARQGRYQGALCGAHEISNPDIRDALHTAFASVHLSALPLSGAWWTGTRFSASVEAFVTPDVLAMEELEALCVLEDDGGRELARFAAPCCKGGYLGVIEAMLPDDACVLTLHCALMKKKETGMQIVEESTLPVYVGDRAPLEAAF